MEITLYGDEDLTVKTQTGVTLEIRTVDVKKALGWAPQATPDCSASLQKRCARKKVGACPVTPHNKPIQKSRMRRRQDRKRSRQAKIQRRILRKRALGKEAVRDAEEV